MKHTLLLIFALSFNSFTFGQKKTIYINDTLAEITKTEFKELPRNSYDIKFKFETDSSVVNAYVKRFTQGKISIKLLDSIKTQFSKKSEVKIKSTDLLVINYLPKDELCSTNLYRSIFKTNYRKNYRKIKNAKNQKHIFVNQINAGIDGFGSKIKWIDDIDIIVQNTFFPIPYNCGGFVIIDKEGSYFLSRFEYNTDAVLNIIKSYFIKGLLLKTQ